MKTSPNRRKSWIGLFAAASLTILAIFIFLGGRTVAQNFPAIIGRIEGDDLEVATATSTGVETNAAPTAVANGSEVTVRSGHALLLLNAGGQVSICGPARFKMIKSSGAVTLALDYGRVHPALESADAFTIYTPTIVATPIAISGGRRDTTLGLGQDGAMCVLTSRGAMRVEPQFSDRSTIVPQGGAVNLAGGEIVSLHADASACSCDFPRASLERPKPAPAASAKPLETERDISALSRPLPPPKRTAVSPAPSAPKEDSVYTVLMPPLSFDAHSPEPPPEPDPETVLLVREVRLRPAAVFRGHVHAAPSQAAAAAVPPPVTPRPSEDRPSQTQPGLLDRARSFIRKLAGRGPCPGADCNG